MSANNSVVPSVLLPELLGFVPQFLLDDIIDTANDAVRQAVDAMEGFLRRWVENRKQIKGADDWDPSQDLEQGLVAFQTLLYSHVDIAFDFFEVWSLRNIFAVPPNLPVVAPHQRGLDLTTPDNAEADLLTEIESLRRKIHAQRKLRRLFTHALSKSSLHRTRSERRLQHLSFLNAPQLQTFLSLPPSFQTMYDSVAMLPEYEDSDPHLVQNQIEPGKRPWEASKSGYLSWAVDTLVRKAGEKDGASGGAGSTVGTIVQLTSEVGSAEDIKTALQALNANINRES
ncbi:hypothetical protein QCA50_011953 [Cerrena zonata]|uniref:Mis12-domain-containing protein n=1 Tax=Cerrena zonata TaxID=2478898 RepID=A0AAW0G181_9APHY